MDTGGKYPVGGPSKGSTAQLPGPGAAPLDVSVNGAGCGNSYDGPVCRAMDMAPPGGLGSTGTPSNSSKR